MCILCYFKNKVGQRSCSDKLGFLFYYMLCCAEGTLHFQHCFSQRFDLRGERFSTSLEHTALKGGINKASAAWKSITWAFVSHPLKMLQLLSLSKSNLSDKSRSVKSAKKRKEISSFLLSEEAARSVTNVSVHTGRKNRKGLRGGTKERQKRRILHFDDPE